MLASGHQPVVLHMGIVAKLIALDLWATKHDAVRLWIVPDMDEVDPGVVRVPIKADDDLRAEHRSLGSPSGLSGPAMTMPPAKGGGGAAFDRLVTFLSDHEHERTRARQFAHAVIDDLCETLEIEPPTIVFASDLASSPIGSSLIDAMFEDPQACVRAYNDSIERSDDAGVKPLAISAERAELPLWSVTGSGRERVYAGEDHERTSLVPRGLAMTAIVRSALCDGFIHGTGGMKYDTITEHWMKMWRNEDLAPIAGASATITLPLELPEGYRDPDRALWEAHHARHDPEMLDEDAAARRKEDLVARIDDLKSKGKDTSALFHELQSLLSQTRMDHEGDLEQFDQRAEQAQRYRAMHAVARDRTWAYPLFPAAALDALREQVRAAIG